ncbi:MAG TPA: hypothetical protein VGH42_12675 [Verrucomicrobiae bacterium]
MKTRELKIGDGRMARTFWSVADMAAHSKTKLRLISLLTGIRHWT